MSDIFNRDPALSVVDLYKQNAPVDVYLMARDIGLIIRLEAMEKGIAGRIVRDRNSSPAGYSIYLNASDSEGRRRFTLAHEIGHYILHRDMIGDGLIDDAMYRSRLSEWYERQANRFAADTLMPAGVVRGLYRGGMVTFSALSAALGVSTEAVRIRLEELKLV